MVSSVSNSSSNISQMMQMMMQSMQQRQDDMFSKIDSNGDGKIDKAEFSDLAKKMSEMSGSSINADDAFTKYDANKDGTLSKDELSSFMKDNAPAPSDGMSGAMGQTGMQGSQSMFDKMFSKIDSSGDGKVDKTEFSAMTKKMSEMSGSSINADEAFSKYDANKDGTLSKDELTSFMKDNAPAPPTGMAGGMSQSGGSSKSNSASYDPKDTNHDGTVSAAEELAYDLKHSVSSAYGSNSSDQLSQLISQLSDMLQKNSVSGSNSAGSSVSITA
jgi:Ca2+-binding EF-hand superfamily protein